MWKQCGALCSWSSKPWNLEEEVDMEISLGEICEAKDGLCVELVGFYASFFCIT